MNKEEAIRIIRGDVLGTNEQTHEAVFMAIKALKAEPKHGEWEKMFMPTEQNPFGDYPILVLRCSACKSKITLLHEEERIKEQWHYCPNCGARMYGDVKDGE